MTEGRCFLVCFDEDCEDAGRAELSGDRVFLSLFCLFMREAGQCRSGSGSLSKAAVTQP